MRQREAVREARVKNVHINIVDILDNRPPKALFFTIATSLKGCKIMFFSRGMDKESSKPMGKILTTLYNNCVINK